VAKKGLTVTRYCNYSIIFIPDIMGITILIVLIPLVDDARTTVTIISIVLTLMTALLFEEKNIEVLLQINVVSLLIIIIISNIIIIPML
jgi:hypothetical protein